MSEQGLDRLQKLAWVIGGMVLAVTLPASAVGASSYSHGEELFQRVSTFPTFLNSAEGEETVAEIVTSALGGTLLIYTDSTLGVVGFVDITDPAQPQAGGVVQVGGEPTSVAAKGGYALACVNTSADFVNTSGELVIIDVVTRQTLRTIQLGGQPDAIAVSPSGRYAAIAIENERDEDLGDGEPPQAPPGYLVIVDLIGDYDQWSTRTVDLVGIADLFPEDPEPEYVAINALEVAAVTLQENNHIVLVWLPSGQVIGDFPVGSVNLSQIDASEDDVIRQVESLQNIPREPDAIVWTSALSFATADEGDLFGGSRGFTIWSAFGWPIFRAGSTLERAAARLGHYPEDRSENKGGEPEGVAYAKYGNERYLFVGSERSNLISVYNLRSGGLFGQAIPQFVQALPAGVGPEGLHAIPERDLFVVANEVDDRGAKVRSSLMIYARSNEANYPTIISGNRAGSQLPIPWAGLSGLAADPHDDDRVYTIYDSVYRESRIFRLDVDQRPARIKKETVLRDGAGSLLLALENLKAQLPGTNDFDPNSFVNADGSVNLDLEGIATTAQGRFWLASEGAGNLEDGISNPDNRPFESPNLLLRTSTSGQIEEVVLLPLDVTRNQFRFGFEGLAVTPHAIYVAFQRAWEDAGDPEEYARIGRYDLQARTWSFAYYPLDPATSPNGGWVGLSEISYLGDGSFAVIERDDQGGPDARIKRIYSFSIDGVTFRTQEQAPAFDILTKSLRLDLLAANTYAISAGPIPEKQEGLTVLKNGHVLLVNDNDGLDDNNGETLLLDLGEILD